jgi:hypothetical protein
MIKARCQCPQFRVTSGPSPGTFPWCSSNPMIGAGVGPSSGPARPRPVRHVGSSTGFAGSPVKERVAGVTAGPGEAGWNPVDAHTRGTSCRSPFDPIEGDAPRRGDLPFPRRPCRNSWYHRRAPRGLGRAGPPHQVAPADLCHPAGAGPRRVVRPARPGQPPPRRHPARLDANPRTGPTGAGPWPRHPGRDDGA